MGNNLANIHKQILEHSNLLELASSMHNNRNWLRESFRHVCHRMGLNHQRVGLSFLSMFSLYNVCCWTTFPFPSSWRVLRLGFFSCMCSAPRWKLFTYTPTPTVLARYSFKTRQVRASASKNKKCPVRRTHPCCPCFPSKHRAYILYDMLYVYHINYLYI